jgi:hypothetical protein
MLMIPIESRCVEAECDMKEGTNAISRWCRPTIALAIVASAAIVSASSAAAAKTSRWNCLFKLRAAAEGLYKDNFSIEFVYDDVTSKAVMIGNQAVADVELHVGPSGVTFSEKLIGGVVQTTTVANDGRSVHSRHTIIGKEMVPSQYYGKCTTTQH